MKYLLAFMLGVLLACLPWWVPVSLLLLFILLASRP